MWVSSINAAGNEQRSGSRTGRIVAGFLVGMLVLLLGLYLADVAFNRGHVPRGTTVGGVEIGGMEPAAAVSKLEQELGGVSSRPVKAAAGEQSTEFVPEQAGLSGDWQRTVDDAGVESLNPVSRLAGFFRNKEVDIVSTIDHDKLVGSAERVAGDLSVKPEDGAVALEGGEVKVTDPKDGQAVNREELERAMSLTWLNPDGVEVEPQVTQPAINDDMIKQIVDGPANKALKGPLTLKGEQDTNAVIEKARMGEVVTFRNDPEAKKIIPEVHGAKAQEIFGEQLKDTVTKMENATISASGEVTPSKDGNEIKWDETMKDFDKRVIGDEPREWEAKYEAVPATFKTEDAEKATFNEEVGSFTTGGFESASGHNIKIVAQQVNGVIVSPGQEFSLNGFTGPRGTAQGYVESGIIIEGRAGRAVGGGISQFATTLYNASYFAGMTDVAHTPHSYYISRYPAGREATVYEGAIDLVFKNDTPHPVKIVTEFGGGQITVKMMGVKSREVESVNGGRWAQTSPQTQSLSGDGCIPSGGAPGFTTSDTRIIRDLGGSEISRETTTTVYDPQPIVRCD